MRVPGHITPTWKVLGLLAVFALAACGGKPAPAAGTSPAGPGASIKITGAYSVNSTDSSNQVFCGSSFKSAPSWVQQQNAQPGNWMIVIKSTTPSSVYLAVWITGYTGSGQYKPSQIGAMVSFSAGNSSVFDYGGDTTVNSGKNDASGDIAITFAVDPNHPYQVAASYVCVPVRS